MSAMVVQLTIPGDSLDEVRAHLDKLRRVFLAAAGEEGDELLEQLAWEIETKQQWLRSRRLKSKRRWNRMENV